MSSSLKTFIENCYKNEEPAVVKTASEVYLEKLRDITKPPVAAQEKVAGVDLQRLSDDELIALLKATDTSTETAGDAAGEAAYSEEVEKLAMDTLGGQIVAHAMIHELGLIKTATLEGLCRVCKNTPYVTGTTLCAACGGE